MRRPKPTPLTALTVGSYMPADFGAVAQLGERHVRNVEVSGSIPLGSTKIPINHFKAK